MNSPSTSPASTPPGSKWARRGLVVLVAIASAELVAAALAYRNGPDAAAWQGLAEAVAELPSGEPVWLADDWLGPAARKHVPQLAGTAAVAPADLRGAATFHVVGLGSAWGPHLRADLEDLPAPVLRARREVGPFTLTSYEQPDAAVIVGDLVADARGLAVEVAGQRCSGRGRFRCQGGRVDVQMVEVEERPRNCLAILVGDARQVRLTHERFATGNVLRGHLGFGDFNARLRNDAPTDLVVRLDGAPVARWTVTDEQGWWPFAVATTPGEHRLEVEVTTALSGIYRGTDYDSTPTRTVCLEVRGLQEPRP